MSVSSRFSSFFIRKTAAPITGRFLPFRKRRSMIQSPAVSDHFQMRRISIATRYILAGNGYVSCIDFRYDPAISIRSLPIYYTQISIYDHFHMVSATNTKNRTNKKLCRVEFRESYSTINFNCYLRID